MDLEDYSSKLRTSKEEYLKAAQNFVDVLDIAISVDGEKTKLIDVLMAESMSLSEELKKITG